MNPDVCAFRRFDFQEAFGPVFHNFDRIAFAELDLHGVTTGAAIGARTHAHVVAIDDTAAVAIEVDVVLRDQTEATGRRHDAKPTCVFFANLNAIAGLQLGDDVVVRTGSAANVDFSRGDRGNVGFDGQHMGRANRKRKGG